MKKLLTAVMILCTCVLMATGCSKKEKGVCYCKYLSGDKKEYNLSSLERGRAQDSCAVLNGYASAFAGDCKLK